MSSWQRSLREASPFLGLGIQIGLGMIMCMGLGVLVDRYLGTAPWGTLAGAILGIASMVARLMRIAADGRA